MYAFISSIGPRWLSPGDLFFDLLITLGVIGAYFGAGLVGWRVADKYFHAREKQFIRQYIRYSIATFILLIIIAYSPLSFLGLLWSFVAPFCVIKALDHIRKPR